jgi:hypothetical protein
LVYFGSGTKDIFLDLPSEVVTNGDVVGPSSAINNNFAAFNLTTGKLIKDSGYNATSFATAAQGAKADTAVQPGSLGSAAYLTAGAANGVATLDAGGKVPTSQIPQMGDLNYQGTWNASTNTPTLTSSAGTKGFYYVVSVAGSTNLNGITDWKVGDWAVFNGSVWEKIDNTDAVTSVNGYTGTVVLTASDVGATPATSGTSILYGNGTGGTSNVTIGSGIAFAGGTLSATGLGGDVVGPSSATDNAIARYNLTTGKLIQNSGVIIDDSNNVSGVNTLTATNLVVNDDTTLGGSNADSIAVNGRITTDLEPASNNAKDIGTSGRNWRDGFFGRNLSTVNLEVTGTTSFDGSQGTSGQVLTSAGTGATPTWTTPTVGTVTSVAALTLGTTGTDLSSTVANGTTTPVITLNVPTASAANRGALSSTDWSTFNGKQAALVSGTNIKTVNGTTLLGSGDLGTIGVGYGGTGQTSFTAGRVLYGNGTSALASSASLFFDGTNLGIGTSSPNAPLTFASTTGRKVGFYQGTQGYSIGVEASNFKFVTDASAIFTWANGATYSTATEYMRLHASGGLSLGNTTDPGAASLSVTGNITASTVSAGQPQAAGKIAFSSVCNGDLGSVGMEIQNTAANPLGTAIQFRGWNSSSTGSITTNVNTTNYNTSSDYRLKNITGKIQSSGTYIDSLNPVEGTWKDTDDVFVGLIAHEAQSVSRTQIVFGQKDGEEMQSMSYSSAEMIANIIAELQSLRKRVLELEAIK